MKRISVLLVGRRSPLGICTCAVAVTSVYAAGDCIIGIRICVCIGIGTAIFVLMDEMGGQLVLQVQLHLLLLMLLLLLF